MFKATKIISDVAYKSIGKRKGKTAPRTGKEEHISAMAIPTNHVKNVTTIQPHIRGAGPA